MNRGVTVNILNFDVAKKSLTEKLMLNIIFSFVQYERDMIWERNQKDKMAARGMNRNYKEGRKTIEKSDNYGGFVAAMKSGDMMVWL